MEDADRYRPTSRPCPLLCPPCALCMLQEEEDWLALLESAEEGNCDCPTIDVGVDPCFAPMSCECICRRSENLSDDCGPAAELVCDRDCPDWYWPESDGTPSCACAAELEMTVGDVSLETSMVTMTAKSDLYIGDIDSLDFTFRWCFDAPAMDDEKTEVICQVRFNMWIWPLSVSPWNLMYRTTTGTGDASPIITCQYYETPTADRVSMRSEDGFISLRRTGDTLEGHISMSLIDSNNPDGKTINIAGPFETTVPRD